jgi:hypothetical protein
MDPQSVSNSNPLFLKSESISLNRESQCAYTGSLYYYGGGEDGSTLSRAVNPCSTQTLRPLHDYTTVFMSIFNLEQVFRIETNRNKILLSTDGADLADLLISFCAIREICGWV